MASIIGRFSVESVLRIAVPALLLLLGLPSAARPEPAPAAGLGFSPAGLTVERDRLYPRHPEPGKFRREINLADGLGGGIYLMAWELDRLSETEWFEAALGPVLLGFRGYEHAWLPGADVAAVVEVPGSHQARPVRVWAVRLGAVGVAALCYGVDDPALSMACDQVAGSLEVRP